MLSHIPNARRLTGRSILRFKDLPVKYEDTKAIRMNCVGIFPLPRKLHDTVHGLLPDMYTRILFGKGYKS